jgi:uncharacterized protein DUF5522
MPSDAELAREDPEEAQTLVALPGEFYYEGPYLVFTEAYHLRRGYCCRSGCRHCPYGFVKPSNA